VPRWFAVAVNFTRGQHRFELATSGQAVG
jgi:hypothetical protein